MWGRRKGLNIVNSVFFRVNIIALICFTALVLWIRNRYSNGGILTVDWAAFEELLKERPDANIIKIFLSSHYFCMVLTLILLVKECLRKRIIVFIINAIVFLGILFFTPMVLGWTLYLVPIFQVQ